MQVLPSPSPCLASCPPHPAPPSTLPFVRILTLPRPFISLVGFRRSNGLRAVPCCAVQSTLPSVAGSAHTMWNACGAQHTVLLRTDGTAVAFGDNVYGNCDIPALDAGLTYTQAAAGGVHTVLLKSDGTAVATGANMGGQCDIPPLDRGLVYTQVAAGRNMALLLKSDGTAVTMGMGSDVVPLSEPPDNDDVAWVPQLDEGLAYAQVAVGLTHVVLLRSDGVVVARGFEETPWMRGETANVHDAMAEEIEASLAAQLPALVAGLTYKQVAAGNYHTVLLRSDGTAVACGHNEHGQCDIPTLDEGLTYTKVAAGGRHTVLPKSDGAAVACGSNARGQCDIPALRGGQTYYYAHVAAGEYHTVQGGQRRTTTVMTMPMPMPFLPAANPPKCALISISKRIHRWRRQSTREAAEGMMSTSASLID